MDSAKKYKNDRSLHTTYLTCHIRNCCFLATVQKVIVTSLDPLPLSSTSRHNNDHISTVIFPANTYNQCSRYHLFSVPHCESEDKTHNIVTLIKACFICYGGEKRRNRNAILDSCCCQENMRAKKFVHCECG